MERNKSVLLVCLDTLVKGVMWRWYGCVLLFVLAIWFCLWVDLRFICVWRFHFSFRVGCIVIKDHPNQSIIIINIKNNYDNNKKY